MKKELLTTLISASIVLSMASVTSFAETEQGYIVDNVDQLKTVLQQ